jgi:glycosyltransferase involved in cell wall biosynthesis
MLIAGARAFLFPPEEDFWLAPIEAMSLGTPVIAYGAGWATETVIDGQTGIFFHPQTTMALSHAINQFESQNFHSETIQEYAMRFSSKEFKNQFSSFIHSHMRKSGHTE